ncbi:MAG: hypothetical protein IK093_07630 [Ruminiclostridium sp.]|nr:hypothetical protein [Ruminiclostridium sp.]
MYFLSADNKDKGELYFVNGTDIPYMELNDYVTNLKALNGDKPKFDIKIKANGDKVTLTRETKYSCVIDFAEDTMYFVDYNAFLKRDEATNLVDDITLPERDENGKRTYLKRVPVGTSERYGSKINLDLASYGIDLVRKGDKYYVPLQTVSDVLMGMMSPLFLYNGKAMFVVIPDLDGFVGSDFKKTPLGKIFYNGKTKGSISKELAEFNYNELCLGLDVNYGLKANHNIKSFDDLMDDTGLKKMMLSGDSEKIDTAMYILSTRYLDDGHTKYGVPGYSGDYKFREKMIKNYGEGAARDSIFALTQAHKDARAKFYPDGVPGYEEISDTAFITFDAFEQFEQDVDYYKTAPTADSKDTIGLVSYSVQQILRKNSPIKNVVLDLSCNGGGATNTAAYTIAAFLGKARLSIEDRYTGAVVTSEYHVDTNLDHKFDSKDYLAGKGLNLYCLESGTSFSCGNLVPCMFKQSSLVTLLGETSGGGAGSIMWLGSAAGGMIRISSATTANFLKNGSLYDVDRGADPDIYLSKLESYYDREKLVEFIDSLL